MDKIQTIIFGAIGFVVLVGLNWYLDLISSDAILPISIFIIVGLLIIVSQNFFVEKKFGSKEITPPEGINRIQGYLMNKSRYNDVIDYESQQDIIEDTKEVYIQGDKEKREFLGVMGRLRRTGEKIAVIWDLTRDRFVKSKGLLEDDERKSPFDYFKHFDFVGYIGKSEQYGRDIPFLPTFTIKDDLVSKPPQTEGESTEQQKPKDEK